MDPILRVVVGKAWWVDVVVGSPCCLFSEAGAAVLTDAGGKSVMIEDLKFHEV